MSFKVIFVFGGSGCHWSNMGLSLLKTRPTFAQVLEEIDQLIHKETGSPLEEILRTKDMSDPFYGQPAIFGIQVALARLFQSFGARPWGIFGVSMGEVAAIHIAGLIPLEDAVKLVCARGKALSIVKGKGRIAGVFNVDVEIITQLIKDHFPEGGLELSQEAGPLHCSLSGEKCALQKAHKILETLEDAKNHRFRLYEDHICCIGYHSSFVDPVLCHLEESVKRIPTFSNCSKKHSTEEEESEPILLSTAYGGKPPISFLDHEYWARNVRKPVLLRQTLKQFDEISGRRKLIFLEFAPEPTLKRYIVDTLGADITYIPTMKREQEENTIDDAIEALKEAGIIDK